MPKEIILSKGRVAVVDDGDFEWLNQWKWSYSGHAYHDDCGYASRNVYGGKKSRAREKVKMHRIIMNPPAGLSIDHIDGNRLNNQRANLRVCTHGENMRNKGMQKNNTSGHIGVWWSKQNRKWQASIRINRKRIHLGYHKEIADAAAAYAAAKIQYFGDFGYKK